MSHTKFTHRERAGESSDRSTETCPECAGPVRSDDARGERVCQQCGLVVDADAVDRGPEWHAFGEDGEESSRVGAPTTTTLHDRGLSTDIDWRDADAGGTPLSDRQRRKMRRLRTWNERYRTRDAQERNLKQALGEVDRMTSALGLPESVRETAAVIYRRALEEDLVAGRSIESVATACVYAAARMATVPRSFDELSNVSRVESSRFERAYRYLVRELALEIQPADPDQYIPRFASRLCVPDGVERLARDLVDAAQAENLHSGKSPVALAAAAVYAAGVLANESLSQREVSDATGVGQPTIQSRYRDLLDGTESRRPFLGDPGTT